MVHSLVAKWYLLFQVDQMYYFHRCMRFRLLLLGYVDLQQLRLSNLNHHGYNRILNRRLRDLKILSVPDHNHQKRQSVFHHCKMDIHYHQQLCFVRRIHRYKIYHLLFRHLLMQRNYQKMGHLISYVLQVYLG